MTTFYDYKVIGFDGWHLIVLMEQQRTHTYRMIHKKRKYSSSDVCSRGIYRSRCNNKREQQGFKSFLKTALLMFCV